MRGEPLSARSSWTVSRRLDRWWFVRRERLEPAIRRFPASRQLQGVRRATAAGADMCIQKIGNSVRLALDGNQRMREMPFEPRRACLG
jgi:hypothetical protein